MTEAETGRAFWACLVVFAIVAGFVIGEGPGPIGTPHFVVWLASVTFGALAIRRFFYPPRKGDE